MMHNNLFLNRLVIFSESGQIAYDETFHRGINIIRGDNSSGKSTITHFIFYVLGGAFGDFVPEARRCSNVFAEVCINNITITLRRPLEKHVDGKISTQSPIYIFWGTYEESKNEQAIWEKYGYKATENRKSFSMVLFELLNLPIVKGDSNITMHQILRLMYIDQESPTSSLFVYEQFDSQITRETVADLLLGIYNEELYEAKRALIKYTKELEIIKATINTSKELLSSKEALNPASIRSIISNKENDIHNIENEIIKLRSTTTSIDYNPTDKLEFQHLTKQITEKREQLFLLENKISLLENEIEDSEFFIETLKKKQQALNNSIKTRELLGGLELEYCPECLTKISHKTPSNKCKLCKEDKEDDRFGATQARRMSLEIDHQIKESEDLLKNNQGELSSSNITHKTLLSELYHLQTLVNHALHDIRTYYDEQIDRLNNQKGFIEGELLQYRTILEQAEKYGKLLRKKEELSTNIEELKVFINQQSNKQNKVKESVYQKIEEYGIYLLKNDLDRQEEFNITTDFKIDFANNLAFLSNKYSKYSASSNFYLKVAARFAIYLASLSVPAMRYPRFIFADNMEDKGIEMLRAQNLQRIIIERLQDFNTQDYQLIYTTSYITKELNESPYVVGEYYTKDNPTLKNINITM